MSDLPISGLPAATLPLAGTEELAIVQSGTTVRAALSSLPASADAQDVFAYACALLEPDALEPIQRDTFSYAISSAEVKILMASFQTRLGASGRMEVRDPARPLPLSGVTLSGTGANSAAWLLDPTLPTYTDPEATYNARMAALPSLPSRYIPLSGTNVRTPLLLGAYGGFIRQVTVFDLTWIAAMCLGAGVNLSNEIGDDAADIQRVGSTLLLPASKLVAWEAFSGAGTGSGGLVTVLVPSTWSAVADGNTYLFRDDFMGASLNTAATWTRAQSSAGNVEINTTYQWLKVIGNESWGANGCFSQATTARAVGKQWLVDVELDRATVDTSIVVGCHDGSGQSYADFARGVLFTGGIGITIYEAGVSRGTVGSGFSVGGVYRVRITLGASSATYEIQGGSEYEPIGSASWDDITPGTSSNSTTPLAFGISGYKGTNYVGDARIIAP